MKINWIIILFLQFFWSKNQEPFNCRITETMISEEEYKFTIDKNAKIPTQIPANFRFATNGEKSDFETKVNVWYSEDYLNVGFECKDDLFVKQNAMYVHNDPLYNQEVFEVFISAGADDPEKYLEVEINPNDAIWIGWIDNPSLGAQTQTLNRMVDPAEAKILHAIEKTEDSWSGTLQIPWKIISNEMNQNYRVNFYRIRSNSSHQDPNWICDEVTCDFVCWSPTLSGKNAAFHRPKRFGLMTVK